MFDPVYFNYYRAAWSGSSLAVLRLTPTPSIELTVHDSNGTLLQAPVLPTNTRWSELAWAGDRFVVAGRTASPSTSAITFAELAADGTLLTEPFSLGSSNDFLLIEGIATSPTTFVVGTRYPSGVIAVDRATHTPTFHRFDLNDLLGARLAYSNGEFAFARPGGPFGGDALQILDEHGAPKYPLGSLIWDSFGTELAATEQGFAAFALYQDTSNVYDYLYARLDLRGDPISAPAWPLATVTSSGGATGVVGSVAHGRTSIAGGYAKQAVRVIQLCD